MPMTLSGDGTITGLSAGGLPDSSIVTADIADAAITAAKMSGGQSGNAPAYAARAWVNFNGTGTVAIRASGNVSSITDNGTGDYTVNFTTAMPDANYGVSLGQTSANNRFSQIRPVSASDSNPVLMSTTQVRILHTDNGTFPGTPNDIATQCVSIFR